MATIQKELEALGDAARVAVLQRFFKTGPGEYAAGDRFRGIRVPVLRRLVRKYQNISLAETRRLLQSPFHEDRLLALLIMIRHYYREDFGETLRIARLLLGDQEDLIHKAVGWMLREVEKRETNVAEAFLQSYYRNMPRTMLRYAIERLPEARRQAYLKGTIAAASKGAEPMADRNPL